MDVRRMGALELAYLGDTIHDFFVRSLLLRAGGTVHRLHKNATRLVNATAQADILRALWPELTEEEQDVVRRGRNANAHHAPPKGASAADYRLATGLEALWGYLYLTGAEERLAALLEKGLSGLQQADATAQRA